MIYEPEQQHTWELIEKQCQDPSRTLHSESAFWQDPGIIPVHTDVGRILLQYLT